MKITSIYVATPMYRIGPFSDTVYYRKCNNKTQCWATVNEYMLFKVRILHRNVKKPLDLCSIFCWVYCKKSWKNLVESTYLINIHNNSVFDMHCSKPIHGPEFQLSKSRSSELYWEQAVFVHATLNANELHLSTPVLPATCPCQGEDAAYFRGSMH